MIHKTIEPKWDEGNPQPCPNTHFGIHHRVAVTLYFLTHSVSLGDAATVFGMSKSLASQYLWQVLACIQLAYPISLPRTGLEWEEL